MERSWRAGRQEEAQKLHNLSSFRDPGLVPISLDSGKEGCGSGAHRLMGFRPPLASLVVILRNRHPLAC